MSGARGAGPGGAGLESGPVTFEKSAQPPGAVRTKVSNNSPPYQSVR